MVRPLGHHPHHPDFSIRHETIWHVTTNADWVYDPQFRPFVAVGLGREDEPGRLYCTPGSMLRFWLPYVAPDEDMPLWAAQLDFTGLNAHTYGSPSAISNARPCLYDGDYVTSRPGGHPELIITRPEAVKVLRVVDSDTAVAIADEAYRQPRR